MITMKEIVKRSIYYDKINCLLQTLGDITPRQIPNLPVIVGRKICGIDIYQLTEELYKQKVLLEVEEALNIEEKDEIKEEE